MIPTSRNLQTTSARMLLLGLLAGSLVGAMLGAAAGFIWAQNQHRESPPTLATENDAALAKISVQLETMRANIQVLQQRTGSTVATLESAAAASDVSLEGAGEHNLQQAFIDQVADRIAAPARARFKQPNYDEAMQRLSMAGFSAYDAERIFAIEAEAQLRFIDAMSNPAVRGSAASSDIIGELGDSLRNYLGDYGYENYLRSKKLPTTVKVRRVEESSAGAAAGLHSGDEIVRYAGRRVFSIQELNNQVNEGSAGELVSIEVLRGGKTTTLEIPRGAIGITASALSPRAVFDLL